MRTARATLGGVTLADASPVAWDQVAGTAAPVKTFIVHENQWGRLKGKVGQPLTLVVRGEGVRDVVWKNLYILREAPTRLPFHRAFVLTDVRWKWPRVLVSRSYNIPRKTGDRRIVGEGPVEVKQPVDLYGHAISSLDGKKKWTARRVLEDVLRRVAEQCKHGWRIDSFPIGDTRQVSVEDLDLNESGDAALAGALRRSPGAEISIDGEGVAFVKDSTDRAAGQAELAKAPVATDQGQIDRLIDLAAIRPANIIMHFQREVEVRFDAREESDDPSATVAPGDPAGEEMLMDNVGVTVDPETTVDGEVLAQGTYRPLRQLVTAWNEDLASLGVSPAPPPLTLANIRKYWFVLEAVYTALGLLTHNAGQQNWAARIACIRTHYRQTYMLPREWMQRMRDLKPHRVGILDPVTGARAPARAWSQFTIEPTAKAQVVGRRAKNPDDHWFWIQCDQYPGVDGEVYDKVLSPAVVEIVDKDLGIIHVNYRLDPHGMRAAIHPSLMKENGTGRLQVPCRDLSKQLKEVMCVDGKVSGTAPLQLADDFAIAVILTASPFAPNDERRLFAFRVKPGDIDGALASQFDVAGGQGPDWHLFVPPNQMTARYAHLTTVKARESAKMLFGFKGGLPVEPTNNPKEAPGYYIVNLGEDGLLQALSRAMATAQWAAFVNAVEGTRAVHLNGSLALRGSMEGLRHRLDHDGRLITEIAMPAARPPMDWTAFVPVGLRTKIFGEVEDRIA